MDEIRKKIYKEIEELRKRQETILGYNSEYDDENTEEMWLDHIYGYATEESVPLFEARMLTVASITIAAIESERRKK